jgi:hypothetical protein
MLLLNQKYGYQDELKATGLILGITVLGSFFFLDRVMKAESPTVLGTQSVSSNQNNDTSSDSVVSNATPYPTVVPQTKEDLLPITQVAIPETVATQTATPSAKPKSEPAVLSNGADQTFENDYFILSFSKSELVIGSSTQAKIQVVLANKKVTEGLVNNLYGIIERKGEVVNSKAPMSASEKKTIMPGEKLTFSASISLPEETDLTKIVFDPGDLDLRTTYNVGSSF